MAEEIEKIYIIPLKKTNYRASNAAPTAIKRVKSYLTRHMKVEEKNIWMDESLNNSLWSRGKYNMPSKIRVKAVKFEDGVVEVSLPELEFKKSRRELLKEEKEKKAPILRRDEEVSEGEEGIDGADDYDIAPTGDGEVKIKKKKAAKDKEEKDKPKSIERKSKPKKDKEEPEKKKAKKTVKIKKAKKEEKPKKKSASAKSSKKTSSKSKGKK